MVDYMRQRVYGYVAVDERGGWIEQELGSGNRMTRTSGLSCSWRVYTIIDVYDIRVDLSEVFFYQRLGTACII